MRTLMNCWWQLEEMLFVLISGPAWNEIDDHRVKSMVPLIFAVFDFHIATISKQFIELIHPPNTRRESSGNNLDLTLALFINSEFPPKVQA